MLCLSNESVADECNRTITPHQHHSARTTTFHHLIKAQWIKQNPALFSLIEYSVTHLEISHIAEVKMGGQCRFTLKTACEIEKNYLNLI